MDQNKVFSGSADCTIKVWSILTGRCIRTIEGHEAEIVSILLQDLLSLWSG